MKIEWRYLNKTVDVSDLIIRDIKRVKEDPQLASQASSILADVGFKG